MSEFNYDPVDAVMRRFSVEDRLKERIAELEAAAKTLCRVALVGTDEERYAAQLEMIAILEKR